MRILCESHILFFLKRFTYATVNVVQMRQPWGLYRLDTFRKPGELVLRRALRVRLRSKYSRVELLREWRCLCSIRTCKGCWSSPVGRRPFSLKLFAGGRTSRQHSIHDRRMTSRERSTGDDRHPSLVLLGHDQHQPENSSTLESMPRSLTREALRTWSSPSLNTNAYVSPTRR